jgi:hypothetical protein
VHLASVSEVFSLNLSQGTGYPDLLFCSFLAEVVGRCWDSNSELATAAFCLIHSTSLFMFFLSLHLALNNICS